MAAVRAAIRQLLTAHEPYPAVVVDRSWNLLDANASVALFTAGRRPDLLAPPANVLRVSLHPEGMAPQHREPGRVASAPARPAAPADRTDRRRRPAPRLYDELRALPVRSAGARDRAARPGEVVVPLRVRHGDRELAFFSTVATFGTPLDVTVSELAIESFFPANPETAAVLRELSEA